MSEKQRSRLRNRALNLLVAGGASLFSLLMGSSLLLGLVVEPEKAESFLLMLGGGLMLGGAGCGLYCYYILAGRGFRPLYYVSLALAVAGYVLASVAQVMYES